MREDVLRSEAIRKGDAMRKRTLERVNARYVERAKKLEETIEAYNDAFILYWQEFVKARKAMELAEEQASAALSREAELRRKFSGHLRSRHHDDEEIWI